MYYVYLTDSMVGTYRMSLRLMAIGGAGGVLGLGGRLLTIGSPRLSASQTPPPNTLEPPPR